VVRPVMGVLTSPTLQISEQSLSIPRIKHILCLGNLQSASKGRKWICISKKDYNYDVMVKCRNETACSRKLGHPQPPRLTHHLTHQDNCAGIGDRQHGTEQLRKMTFLNMSLPSSREKSSDQFLPSSTIVSNGLLLFVFSFASIGESYDGKKTTRR
jgi:hypothetical protein